MSYVAGEWSLRAPSGAAGTSGGGAAQRVLARLAAGAGNFAPDGVSTMLDGTLGMVHGRMGTTASGRRECQPLKHADVVLVWDGHLDHRRRLARELISGDGGPGAGTEIDLEDLTDPEWVVAAYRRWGTDVFDHLAGEYALALYDRSAQELHLARDPSGARSLFYLSTEQTVTWATTLDALLDARPETPTDLDEQWIAGYLTGSLCPGATPYRALREVPSAHVLTFTRCGDRLQRSEARFWRPEELPELRLADDREYEEAFRAAFFRAVAEHLRAQGPVFLELSGGVDSSSIACVADRLLRRGEVEARDLETVSYVFDAARHADERRWIRLVEDRIGRPAHHVLEDDYPLLDGFDEPASHDAPNLLPVYQRRHERVAELMAEAGSRVLLTGIGGDNVVWGEFIQPPQLADLIRAGRWVDLFGQLRQWQPAQGSPYLQLLWQGGIRPLLPWGGRSQMGLVRRRMPWVNRSFARRTGLDERLRQPAVEKVRWQRPSRGEQYALVRDASHRQISPNYHEMALIGAEMRYPFLDRPFVELCLSLPAEQFVRPGESRSLHRRALRGLLPEAIADRRDKGGPDQALILGLSREWPRLLALFADDARIYRHGFVDRGRFLASLEARRFGLVRQSVQVEGAISLEVWLRDLERRRPGEVACRSAVA